MTASIVILIYIAFGYWHAVKTELIPFEDLMQYGPCVRLVLFVSYALSSVPVWIATQIDMIILGRDRFS